MDEENHSKDNCDSLRQELIQSDEDEKPDSGDTAEVKAYGDQLDVNVNAEGTSNGPLGFQVWT